jgi:uncharacterized membrane protein
MTICSVPDKIFIGILIVVGIFALFVPHIYNKIIIINDKNADPLTAAVRERLYI